MRTHEQVLNNCFPPGGSFSIQLGSWGWVGGRSYPAVPCFGSELPEMPQLQDRERVYTVGVLSELV